MIIDVNGDSYQLLIQAQAISIEIAGFEQDMVQLSVPVKLPIAELYAYIEHNKTVLRRYKNKVVAEGLASQLQIFGKSYPLVTRLEHKNPFIQHGVVYAATIPKTLSASQVLLKKLLFQELNLQVSQWEERLSVLSTEIKIRKLKTNYFSVCPKNETISFSAELSQKSTEFISFIVGEALMKFAAIDHEKQNDLLNKFVKDWKQFQRIIAFERSYTGF